MVRNTSKTLTSAGIVGLAVLPLLFLAACGSSTKPATPDAAPGKAPAAKAAADDGHGHGAAGAKSGSCIVLDIGSHEFLGDMDFDSAAGSVALVVNNHATGKAYPHAKAEAFLNVTLASGTAQIPLVADPVQGEPEGKTSRYKASAPELKGLKALKGRVNLTIDGKTYICDLEGGAKH